MFGYVRPSAARLTEEDMDRFGAAYCGLCRTMGKRHGQAARFALNYDFAFLALLLWPEETGEPLRRGCMAHPLKGRAYFPENPALSLAADQGMILAWWQVQDALADPGRGRGKYRAAAAALGGAYRRARACRPAFDRTTRQHLERLRALEEAGCPTLDEPADDLAEDFASGSYNPLIRRYGLEQGALTEEAREGLAVSLDHSIRLMAAAYELWDFGVWNPIIRATVYEGLFLVGKAVLDGTFQAGAPAFHAARRNKEQL